MNREADIAVSRHLHQGGPHPEIPPGRVYNEPSIGLYHNPMNCYRSQGFTLIGDVEMQPLKAANRPDTECQHDDLGRTEQRESDRGLLV